MKRSGGIWRQIRLWQSETYISAIVVITPRSAGELMAASPKVALGHLAAWLTGNREQETPEPESAQDRPNPPRCSKEHADELARMFESRSGDLPCLEDDEAFSSFLERTSLSDVEVSLYANQVITTRPDLIGREMDVIDILSRIHRDDTQECINGILQWPN